MSTTNDSFCPEPPEGWKDRTIHCLLGPQDRAVQHNLNVVVGPHLQTDDLNEYACDRIQCDNEREFISRALDKWACENGVTMDFSRSGKPMDNAMIESFNGSFRDECLNVNWFLSMEDARKKIDKWRRDYNELRAHSSLGDLTPRQFVDKYRSN